MSASIVIISDLHANFAAVKILEPKIRAADHVLCLGDFVGYYCEVNEVIEFMRGIQAICVRGNHDQYLLSGCPPDLPDAVRFGIEYADRVIHAGNRSWLESLPLLWGGMVAGRSMLISHGSPFRPLTDYLYADRVESVPLALFDFDVVAFGQTHRPFESKLMRPKLVNPGSVGQSRHRYAVATAARLDAESMHVEFFEEPYEPTETMALARQHGAGDWITKHLVP